MKKWERKRNLINFTLLGRILAREGWIWGGETNQCKTWGLFMASWGWIE